MGAFSIPAIGQNDSGVVAEIDGRKVTTEELGAQASRQIASGPGTSTTSPSATCSTNTLTIQLLEYAAKKEGVTLDELIQASHRHSMCPGTYGRSAPLLL